MNGADGDRGEPGDRPGSARRLGGRRSQLVLVAAGVIAIGLLPVVLAYTQLGYTGMAASEPTATAATDDALRAVERSAFAASEEAQAAAPWSARATVVDDVTARFDPRVRAIETGSVRRAVAHEVERNTSVATAWASTNCSDGPNRDFGPCEAIDGVVVQERQGTTHVLAIVVDLRTVVEGVTHHGTYVLDAETGA